ncbi:ATP-grasp domain-containing protein [Actinomadura xylanilytica]|uniref:preATP grasp domain-containing protein n=1 Tax=Actinomadura xylanilytica TaxID=887459 RepID=UPI00255AA9A2|nr:ATP-grasp domain-containing protein [Actinomadura xylanilytica]MDL4774214.1 ATP-grasp domain-containing protein [Actinomadura xylanilytica]
MDFNERLKSALTGAPDTSLVLLGNFEVEDQWARGETGLPRLAFGSDSVIVNRMDEFALLLAGKSDHVVLKTAPDSDFLAYLEDLGFDLPGILPVARNDPRNLVTEDALADPALLTELGVLGAEGAALSAHGVSELEERLAATAGIALAAPSAATCKAVNSKIYSRRLADALGIRQARGWTCDDVAGLEEAFTAARAVLAAGRPVVVKDAYGVSGKGIELVEGERRLDRLLRMITKRAGQAAGGRLGLVVEEWVGKRADLNYQFTVGRDGGVRFDFVKEALTERGVHKGHRIPARLTERQVSELKDVSGRLGESLAADGYYGVVGVDAMVDPDGGLYPVVEINARNNMSTYQAAIQEAFLGERAAAGTTALVRQYPLRLTRPLPFGSLRDVLGDLLFDAPGGTGLLVNNHATVNAAAPASAEPADATDRPFAGRLYGVVIAPSAERMTALDGEIGRRLAALGERSSPDVA